MSTTTTGRVADIRFAITFQLRADPNRPCAISNGVPFGPSYKTVFNILLTYRFAHIDCQPHRAIRFAGMCGVLVAIMQTTHRVWCEDAVAGYEKGRHIKCGGLICVGCVLTHHPQRFG
jgi:hypothetical protein